MENCTRSNSDGREVDDQREDRIVYPASVMATAAKELPQAPGSAFLTPSPSPSSSYTRPSMAYNALDRTMFPYKANCNVTWPPCVNSNTPCQQVDVFYQVSESDALIQRASPAPAAAEPSSWIVLFGGSVFEGGTVTRVSACNYVARFSLPDSLPTGVISFVMAGQHTAIPLESLTISARVPVFPSNITASILQLFWSMMQELDDTHQLPNMPACPFHIFNQQFSNLPTSMQSAAIAAWRDHFLPFATDMDYLLSCSPYASSGSESSFTNEFTDEFTNDGSTAYATTDAEVYHHVLSAMVSYLCEQEMWDCLEHLFQLVAHAGWSISDITLPNPVGPPIEPEEPSWRSALRTSSSNGSLTSSLSSPYSLESSHSHPSSDGYMSSCSNEEAGDSMPDNDSQVADQSGNDGRERQIRNGMGRTSFATGEPSESYECDDDDDDDDNVYTNRWESTRHGWSDVRNVAAETFESALPAVAWNDDEPSVVSVDINAPWQMQDQGHQLADGGFFAPDVSPGAQSDVDTNGSAGGSQDDEGYNDAMATVIELGYGRQYMQHLWPCGADADSATAGQVGGPDASIDPYSVDEKDDALTHGLNSGVRDQQMRHSWLSNHKDLRGCQQETYHSPRQPLDTWQPAATHGSYKQHYNDELAAANHSTKQLHGYEREGAHSGHKAVTATAHMCRRMIKHVRGLLQHVSAMLQASASLLLRDPFHLLLLIFLSTWWCATVILASSKSAEAHLGMWLCSTAVYVIAAVLLLEGGKTILNNFFFVFHTVTVLWWSLLTLVSVLWQLDWSDAPIVLLALLYPFTWLSSISVRAICKVDILTQMAGGLIELVAMVLSIRYTKAWTRA